MKISRSPEYVGLFYQYDIDLETKTLYMGSQSSLDGAESGVNYEMTENMLKGLHILDSMDHEIPITVIMNNVGGCEYHGMAIFDKMKSCESRVIIDVYGHAMSMGSYILQAGDHRRMAPNSRIMIHYGTPNITEDMSTPEAKKIMAETDKWTKLFEDLMLEKIREKNPKYATARYRKNMTYDWFLDAHEALEIGLIDEVIEP